MKHNNTPDSGSHAAERNRITEIVCILDRSGSMSGFESDTVGGFNAMLEQQRAEEGEALVTTFLFHTHPTLLHDRVPLTELAPMKLSDFRVGGCTALLDAIGGAIRHVASIHKYARPEDVPSHTVFFITTDGMENASREFDRESVRRMIREQEQMHGWKFIFAAAGIDAEETAREIGIREELAVNYRQSEEGLADCYAAVSEVVASVRQSRCIDTQAFKARVKGRGEKRT